MFRKKNTACFLFVLCSVVFIKPAQADSIPAELDDVEKSIWKYNSSKFIGTGFFIGEKHFLTNFHVLVGAGKEGMPDESSIQEVKLTQEESAEILKIKKVLHISAMYDLALLEIEGEVSDYLRLEENALGSEKDWYVFGYPYGLFKKMISKKEYNTSNSYKDDYSFEFVVNHSFLGGASGSPVLNSEGKVIGVLYKDSENRGFAINLENIEAFANRDIGLDCSNFVGLRSCIKEEIENLTQKAEQGYALAQSVLANFYYNGLGTDQNYKKAYYWFKKSAEQGYAGAQYSLADLYYEGLGTDQNYERAFYWAKKSAEQGFTIAQYSLAGLYYEGLGTDQNYERAFYWMKKSAEQGYDKAQYDLAVLYYSGKGTEVNYKKAFFWYKRSAEQGYAMAQYDLAVLYYYGKGTDQNYERAFYWSKKSAEQGHLLAQELLNILNDQ